MSNYLNQLVAKNLNLIDTVQPFALSAFGFLPESPTEIVMGNNGDFDSELSSLQGRGEYISSNQPTEDAYNQISSQTLPTSEGQQLIPVQIAEKNTSVSYLEVEQLTQKATEPNGQQPVKIDETVFPSQSQKVVYSKPLPMSLSEVGAVEPTSHQTSNQISNQTSNQILPTQEGQQLIPAQVIETNTNVQYLEVEQVTQKATEANEQQPVKINKTVFPHQSQKVVYSNPLPMSLSEVGAVEPTFHQTSNQISNQTSNQILPTQEGQQLIPAQVIKTNTNVQYLEVEQLTQKATEPNGQQLVKIHENIFPSQSQKVVSSKPLPMSLSEVGAVEPISNQTSNKIINQILPTEEGQQLISAQVVEKNKNAPYLEVEQLTQKAIKPTQKATEPKGQQPVKIDENVFPHQSQKVVSLKPLPMLLSEVGAVEPISNQTSNKIINQISNQILPTQERQQLIPAQVAEINTSVAHLEVEQVTQKATETKGKGQQPVKIESVFPSQLQKVVSSKPLLAPLSEVRAVEPISNQTFNQTFNPILPTQERQQLIPAQVAETNTSVANLEVEQVTQKATEAKGKGQQPVKSDETVFPPQLQKVVASKPLPMSLLEVGAVEPISNQTSNQMLPTKDGQQLYQKRVRNSLLNKRQNATDASFLSMTEDASFLSMTEDASFLGMTEDASFLSMTEDASFLSMTEDASLLGITTVQPTTHFPDNSLYPTSNIIQPINDDGRRHAVFVSASKQEPQQRESFGNTATPPTIQVSIGRMEIRTPPPPPPPRPKPRPKPPVMSLDEYLRQRSRGR